MRCLSLIVALLATCASALGDGLVQRVFVDRSRYAPGESVTVTVEMSNAAGSGWNGWLSVEIWKSATLLQTLGRNITVPANTTDPQAETFTWTAPPLDYRGYTLVARAGEAAASTALDVSSTWTRYPRYGYLTEFYIGQSPPENVALLSRDYHINALQFYDWMWRHEDPVKRVNGQVADFWYDWRNAAISVSGLHTLISEAHDRGMAAMAYTQIYAARENYEQSGVQYAWGAFANTNHTGQYSHQMSSDMYVYLFNPASTAWQEYLMPKLTDTIQSIGFDGIHYDQLGRKDPVYDYSGGTILMADGTAFTSMLSRTRSHLDWLNTWLPAPLGRYAMTFNLVGATVNGWGIPDVVANAPIDFLYAEVWNNETYQGVGDFIKWARQSGGGKPLVLAAYMNYSDSITELNEPSVRLADAVFSVCGAFHLELGDGADMLSHEFFPWQRLQTTDAIRGAMKRHYDFITAHEDLLFAMPEAMDTGLQWLTVGHAKASFSPTADTIWTVRQRRGDAEVIHLVNLLGNDDQWRNAANAPPTLTQIPITNRTGSNVTTAGVYVGSPDAGTPQLTSLPFTSGSDSSGPYISFTVPSLQYWSMIVVQRAAGTTSTRYEAETAIKTSVGTNTNHTGYSGTGFVDQFAGTDDGVSFYISVPADGSYELRFRYANAMGATATRNVYLDGQYVGQVSMPSLANWNTWATATLTAAIKGGQHQLVFGWGGSTAINLDYLEVPTPTQGLVGTYYQPATVSNPKLSRIDSTVNFDWGTGTPDSSLSGDGFLIRWTGRVLAPTTGRYAFYTVSDDAVRLWIDHQLIVDQWIAHAATEHSGQIDLVAGHAYDLTLAYREDSGNAVMKLLWQGPNVAKQVVPAANLIPSAGSADHQAPSMPSILTIAGLTRTSISLMWSPAVDDSGIVGYEVRRNGVLVSGQAETSFTDTASTFGSTYTYAVRAIDLEGNVSADVESEVTLAAPADFNLDGYVNDNDLAFFTTCLTSANLDVIPACSAADLDGDGDADLDDFGILQRCLRGMESQVDPACGK